MERVVFSLSGFVNPERGALRLQMLEMGAEYQSDWNSNCTLLLCSFVNTPKFRQVKAEGGTIISKKWHPDKHKNGDTATSKFQEINEAYHDEIRSLLSRDFEVDPPLDPCTVARLSIAP